MIDDSLLKTNFLGRDGFRWWVGQVAPFALGTAQADQNNGAGWSQRVKVRILGYHPPNPEELKNEDLPWAQILMPTTSGSGAANLAQNHKVRPGDQVFGFFLDGDNAQVPVIIGIFGRTSEVIQEPYKAPFIPFTGYNSRMEAPTLATLEDDETIESSTQSQKSPRDAPPETIEAINAETPPNYRKEVPYFTAIGQTVPLATPCENPSIGGIIGLISNLFSAVTGFQAGFINIPLEISRTVTAIQAYSNGIVGSMFQSLGNRLIDPMREGLANLFNDVKSQFAIENEGILAGVAAQENMVGPVLALEQALLCGIGNVVNGLGDFIKELIDDVLNNVENFVSCVGTQFVGSLINNIAGKIQDYISPFLDGVSDILDKGFDVFGAITSDVASVLPIAAIFDCEQSDEKCGDIFKEYIIGKGVVDFVEDPGAIIANARVSRNIGEIFTNFSTKELPLASQVASAIPVCDTAVPAFFEAPIIRIFGGNPECQDEKDQAKAILGSFAKGTSGTITGSIVGVKITKKGCKYKYPPFVEVVDSSGRGYGALARAKINNNTGELEDIYMVSIGENYPIGGTKIDATRVPTTGPGGIILNDTPSRSVNTTVGFGNDTTNDDNEPKIIKTGINYSDGDLLVDPENNPILTNFDSEIGVKVDDRGRIVGLYTLNNSPLVISSTTLTRYRVRSENGFGADIRPVIGTEITSTVGVQTSTTRLTKIVDC